MNCPACGTALEHDAQFCPKCYRPVAAPGFWQKLVAFFQRQPRGPRRPIVSIKKTITIRSTDGSGQKHEYHSLDEVPPELAQEIKRLETDALKEATRTTSADGLTTHITGHKSISVFKIKDASGRERVYHSLDELPPEIRAAVEAAQKGKTPP